MVSRPPEQPACRVRCCMLPGCARLLTTGLLSPSQLHPTLSTRVSSQQARPGGSCHQPVHSDLPALPHPRGPQPRVHLLSAPALPSARCRPGPASAVVLACTLRPTGRPAVTVTVPTLAEWEPRPGPGTRSVLRDSHRDSATLLRSGGLVLLCPPLVCPFPGPRGRKDRERGCARVGLTACAVLQRLACAACARALRGLGRLLGHLVLGARDLDGEELPADGLPQGPDGSLHALLCPPPHAVRLAGVCRSKRTSHTAPLSPPSPPFRPSCLFPRLPLCRHRHRTGPGEAPWLRPSDRWGD